MTIRLLQACYLPRHPHNNTVKPVRPAARTCILAIVMTPSTRAVVPERKRLMEPRTGRPKKASTDMLYTEEGKEGVRNVLQPYCHKYVSIL